MVEYIETKLGEHGEPKIFVFAEGYDNETVSEEYKYVHKYNRLLGIRFFSVTNAEYPRNAVEVLNGLLQLFYAVTPFVIAVNPITSFIRCVKGQKNEDLLVSLFILFAHRVCYPQVYLLNPAEDTTEIEKQLEKITYPEPPVNTDYPLTPVSGAVKALRTWDLNGGNFLDTEHV